MTKMKLSEPSHPFLCSFWLMISQHASNAEHVISKIIFVLLLEIFKYSESSCFILLTVSISYFSLVCLCVHACVCVCT